jgi:hypothetical protein
MAGNICGLWVGLSITVGSDKVEKCLTEWFPRVEIATEESAMRSNRHAWPAIVFQLSVLEGVIDFPIRIDFLRFPGEDDQAVEIGVVLARLFSTALECPTVCDGSGLGDNQGPYWAVIWIGGRPFLADDCSTAFGDGEGGLVEVIRELSLDENELDRQGALTRPTGRSRSRRFSE